MSVADCREKRYHRTYDAARSLLPVSGKGRGGERESGGRGESEKGEAVDSMMLNPLSGFFNLILVKDIVEPRMRSRQPALTGPDCVAK
jgi:hypothetical protein